MNFRVLAASAQAPQRSNGNDFPPHNAPRLEKGGGVDGEGRGRLLKEDGGAADLQRGLLCLNAAPIFRMLFIFWAVLVLSACK